MQPLLCLQDVESISPDDPYYVCDAEVCFEACVPVYRGDAVVGIIDLEAWKANNLSPREVACLFAVCSALGAVNLGK
jgi:putative methionine-R-sulfoxide reductase with GAF domain